MRNLLTLCSIIILLLSCNQTKEPAENIKRDLVINVSTEVGKGTNEHVGSAIGKVQQTDAFLSILVPRYTHDRQTPYSMHILFYNIAGKFFHDPSRIEQSKEEYGNRGTVRTLITHVGYENVKTDSGLFPNCLKQKTVVINNDPDNRNELESALVNGTRYLWFAQGVGIVKIRYEHSNGIVTEAELIDYNIPEKSNAFVPLTPDTTWTYRWKNDYYNQILIDTISVLERNPKREGIPLKTTVTSENGEQMGENTFEIIKSQMYSELVVGGGSIGGSYKGRESVSGSSSLFFHHLSAIWAKLLQLPITIGTTWEQEGMNNSRIQSTLVGNESVEIGPNEYQECLKLKSVFSGATADENANEDTLQRIALYNGTRYLWFAKGIGIVKMRYEHSNGIVTEAELTEYNVPEKSNEYFPLNIGTTWTYTWHNDYHFAPMTEKVKVVEHGSGFETPLSHARYVVTVSEDKPSEAKIECTFTPVEKNGKIIKLRQGTDDAYIPSHTITLVDSKRQISNRSGRAEGWKFKFPRGYISPLKLTYDVSLENAQRLKTIRENRREEQGLPQEFRFQTLEPNLMNDRMFWIGKALFMVGGTNRDIEVSFNLPDGWNASTPWRRIGTKDNHYTVTDQSELINSLLLIGQHKEEIAKSGKVNVTLAIGGNLSPYEKLIDDTVENYLSAYSSIFNDGPDDKVLFIINPNQADDQKGGEGLGITRSVSILMDNYLDEMDKHLWAPFIGHEVFHVWNGLTALEPFSGHEHWFQEGVTEYYSNLASLKLGYLTESEYLDRLENACEVYLSALDEFSISEARDLRLSYQGGNIIAAALDYEIREHKKNRKSLNHVMELMYQQFDNVNVEYTQRDIINTINKVSGKDFEPFFQKYIEGKEQLPLVEYSDKAGLDVIVTNEELPTSDYVNEVVRSSLALQTNVRVIGFNGVRIGKLKELRKIAKHWKSGEVATLVYENNGKPLADTTELKGVTEAPPTESELVVRITEKVKKTKLQRAIFTSIFGKH